jgi:integrase
VLIGLFSGMRLGEICSLDVRDVKERDGVTYFDIVAAKSEAGVRCVPVHSRLIDLGFLDYVKHICKGSLWPGLKAGGPYKAKAYVMSKAFVRWRRSYEVDRPQVAFHSLRKNVVDALENAGVHSSAVALVVGHEGGRGFTFGTYSGGLRLPGLRDVVERIWFRGLVSETAEGHQYCVWLPH